MARKNLYVAYGSNLSVAQMALRCPHARVVGAGVLKNWRLIFKVHATVDQTYPSLGYSVPVLVWELTPACEAALDRYEGYRPDGRGYYMKKHVMVHMGESKRKAMIYVMNPRSFALPDKGYFTIIHSAYRDLGFDKLILETAIQESRNGVKGVGRNTLEEAQPMTSYIAQLS